MTCNGDGESMTPEARPRPKASKAQCSGGDRLEDSAELSLRHVDIRDKDRRASSDKAEAGPRTQRMLVGAETSGGEHKELRGLVRSDSELVDLLVKLQDHHWRIHRSELDICVRPDGTDCIIAEGSCGKVYRGVLNKSLTVAIKSISCPSEKARVAFIHEAVILMNMRHANIVQFLGAVLEDKALLLITEYLPRGSLFDAIASDTKEQLRWPRRGRTVALDIVRGLAHMHGRNALHRDLKSKNVLLSRDWHAKLCDLAMCSLLDSGDDMERSTGTLEYTAPEVLDGRVKEPTKASDIFSLGVILWEIASGKMPDNRDFSLSVPEDCPESVRDLIERCTSSDADARPPIEEVFKLLSDKAIPRTRPFSTQDLDQSPST